MLPGRNRLEAQLTAHVDLVTRSHGGLVLLTGEAGIGKTTLLAAALDEARAQGALVLSGSCWDAGGAPDLWPWLQVMRGLRRAGEASAPPATDAGGSPGVAPRPGGPVPRWPELVRAAGPALLAFLGESPGDLTDGVESRFALYDAVTTALVSASAARPVLVALDDLHWADGPSLDLLDFAVQHIWFERVLVLGAYRDTEVDGTEHAARASLTALAAKATVLGLTGLTLDEVAALLERAAGTRPDRELAEQVWSWTGGNPFFVEQAARLWASGNDPLALAPGVQAAVHARLDALPEPSLDLLAAGAVLGRELDAGTLADVAGLDAGRSAELLAPAAAARLVQRLPGARIRFSHDLVRQVLYDSLPAPERHRLHAAVVRASDQPGTGRSGASGGASETWRPQPAPAGQLALLLPAELAHHAEQAGDELDTEQVVELLVLAAQDAEHRLAFGEAARHYQRAGRRSGELTDPARQVTIALAEARARHAGGDRAAATQALRAAVDRARQLDEPLLLARAALLAHSQPGGWDLPAGPLIDEALRRLGRPAGQDTAPHEPGFTDSQVRDLLVRTVEAARQRGDDESLAFTLEVLHDTVWGLGTAAERVALTDDLTELGRRTGDIEARYLGVALGWVARLELGDPGYLASIRSLATMAEQEGLPRYRLYSALDRSIVATFRGDFPEARELLDQLRVFVGEGGQGTDDRIFGLMPYHVEWALLLAQGDFDALAELHRTLDERHHPFPRLLKSITAAAQGDVDAALLHVTERLATGSPYPRIGLPMWLRLLAQVGAATRDPALCQLAREALDPYSDQWLVSLYGCDVAGPVALWLGRVEAATGNLDGAVEHLRAAHRSAELLGSRPWSIEARAALAAALFDRDAPGDADTADRLAASARSTAGEIGLHHLPHPLDEAGLRGGTVAATGSRHRRDHAGSGGPAADASELSFDGSVWTLRYAGRTVHLPDAKGLRDLHMLLSSPGTEVAATRLLDPGGGETVVAAASLGGDPVLDDRAKAEFRRRLEELDEAIERAVARGDDDQAAALDAERARLLDELRLAAGLGGRSRRLGDAAERARKAVSARIRDTLRRLDQRHPDLAEHLRTSVSTGATCTYRPPEPIRWTL